MTDSESESDFQSAINSASDFDSTSESGSESDFSSVFMNLGVCIFFTLFFNSHSRINSNASNAGIMHIFFWRLITQKVCFNFAVKFSYFGFYVCFIINRFAMKFNASFIFNDIPNLFIFFLHLVIFNQKRHVFAPVFKVFNVSTHLR